MRMRWCSIEVAAIFGPSHSHTGGSPSSVAANEAFLDEVAAIFGGLAFFGAGSTHSCFVAFCSAILPSAAPSEVPLRR